MIVSDYAWLIIISCCSCCWFYRDLPTVIRYKTFVSFYSVHSCVQCKQYYFEPC